MLASFAAASPNNKRGEQPVVSSDHLMIANTTPETSVEHVQLHRSTLCHSVIWGLLLLVVFSALCYEFFPRGSSSDCSEPCVDRIRVEFEPALAYSHKYNGTIRAKMSQSPRNQTNNTYKWTETRFVCNIDRSELTYWQQTPDAPTMDLHCTNTEFVILARPHGIVLDVVAELPFGDDEKDHRKIELEPVAYSEEVNYNECPTTCVSAHILL